MNIGQRNRISGAESSRWNLLFWEQLTKSHFHEENNMFSVLLFTLHLFGMCLGHEIYAPSPGFFDAPGRLSYLWNKDNSGNRNYFGPLLLCSKQLFFSHSLSCDLNDLDGSRLTRLHTLRISAAKVAMVDCFIQNREALKRTALRPDAIPQVSIEQPVRLTKAIFRSRTITG